MIKAIFRAIPAAIAVVYATSCTTLRHSPAWRQTIQAVAAPDRPVEDRIRDPDRKPAEVLAFLGIQPGMEVADMMAGRGYYTEILSHLVGPEGKVYAQNNAFVIKKFAGPALDARLQDNRLPNVVRIDSELETPNLPSARLDAVMMVLFYHDSCWMGTDRAAMNKAIYSALKPGGLYAVVDHHAMANSGVRDVKTLHRIDAGLVLQEVLAAGFVLDGKSDLLCHADDTRELNVFDPEIRGKTDRFIYRFRKPAQ